MGSSAKTGKKISAGHRSSFWIKLIWDRTLPSYTSTAVICGGEGSRIPNLQMEFNYLNSFKSFGIFSDFVVPTWLPSSQQCPHHPHIIPIASRRSPCGPHGCGLRGLHGLHPMLSPLSPHHPHIVSIIPMSSPCHLEGPHIISNSPDTHSTHPLPP